MEEPPVIEDQPFVEEQPVLEEGETMEEPPFTEEEAETTAMPVTPTQESTSTEESTSTQQATTAEEWMARYTEEAIADMAMCRASMLAVANTCESPGTDPAGWSTDEDDDEEVTGKTPAAKTKHGYTAANTKHGYTAVLPNNGYAAAPPKKDSAAAPTKQTSFECTWTAGSCKRTFKTHSRMLDHVRAVHMEKRFKCPGCVKSFTYKCDVKRHHTRRHKAGPPLILPSKAKHGRAKTRHSSSMTV